MSLFAVAAHLGFPSSANADRIAAFGLGNVVG